jgi:hypothetical protein
VSTTNQPDLVMNKIANFFVFLILTTGFLSSCMDGGSTSNKTELEGTWVSSCRNSSNNVQNEIKTFDVTGAQAELRIEGYGETDNQTCSTLWYVMRYSLDNLTVSDSSYSYKHMNFNSTASYWTAKDASVASTFNSRNTCGKTDWIADTEVDVTSDTTGCSLGENFWYQIFKIDGNQVTFGQQDLSSFPTSLVVDDVYIKQ